MQPIAATTLYLGLFGLLMLALKLNVGRVRTGEKVMFGDGANEAMQRAIRVQGNAVEDVPVVMLGLIGLGQMEAPVLLIHAIGASFLLGRILHAAGLGSSAGVTMGRFAGTLLSMVAMIVTAGACIWFALS